MKFQENMKRTLLDVTISLSLSLSLSLPVAKVPQRICAKTGDATERWF